MGSSNSINSFFQAIFILDAESGNSLVAKSYSKKNYDDDLVSGMFKALESFVNHLAYTSNYEHLHEISFGESRIVYERLGNSLVLGSTPLLGVAIVKDSTNPTKIHMVLNNILEKFSEDYSQYLLHFRGNTKPFQSFSRSLVDLNQYLDSHFINSSIGSRTNYTKPFNSPHFSQNL